MKIEDEVLSVLSACRVEPGAVYLPPEQLDRGLYARVNKVLEAMGGKWNRKAKAHLFPADPSDVLDDALLTGEVLDARADFQFFETPRSVVEDMIWYLRIRPREDVLEPSAGRGAIADRVRMLHPDARIRCVELMPENVRALRDKGHEVVEGDFLAVRGLPRFDKVAMNPPFRRCADANHVLCAFNHLRLGGRLAAVVSAGITFRLDAKPRAIRELVAAHGGTIEALPPGTFKQSGTSVNTALIFVEKKK